MDLNARTVATGMAPVYRKFRSDYVRESHHARIRELFPKAELDSIPEAGHWVHAEQPAAFLERVRSILG